jgi:type II secretory pathway pseudopilin PulG
MRNKRHQPAGWMIADVLIAMAIIVILATVLATAVTRQQRASNHLADSRAAARLAEQTLTALQRGDAAPPAPEAAKIEVRAVDAPAPSTTSRWVQVRATLRGRSSDVIGIVRADAAGAK